MEELLSAIDNSCTIDSEVINKRKSQFKWNSRKEGSYRDERRLELLEDYKRKREILLNEKRGLLNDEFNDNDEDWMDWQEPKKNHHRKWINNNCKDQLMLSEWLVDTPSDLASMWTCVLCPEGQRTLVIAKKGCTRAYHKSGFLLAKFKSVLPNGAPSNCTRKSDFIIVDCIWKSQTKQLFALDVLYWHNQALLNCDAQFRLYWIKSKLSEVRRSQAVEEDVYDVFLPTHCTLPNLSTELAAQDPSQVDGILFYHNNAPYISGQTPLVGWLKPYMLPERLGIPVSPEYMALKPDTYVNLEQWVANVSHFHSRKPKKKGAGKMDTDVSSPASDVSGETCVDEIDNDEVFPNGLSTMEN